MKNVEASNNGKGGIIIDGGASVSMEDVITRDNGGPGLSISDTPSLIPVSQVKKTILALAVGLIATVGGGLILYFAFGIGH